MWTVGVMLLVMICQGGVQRYTGFSYIDEISVLLLGGYFVYAVWRKSYFLPKEETGILLCVLIFYFVGSISTVVYNYQNNIAYGLVSGVFCIKAFIAYLGGRAFFNFRTVELEKMKKWVLFFENILIISALLLLIDCFVPLFGEKTGSVYGFSSSAFVFPHATELAAFGVCLLMLSVYIRSILKLKKKIYRNFLPSVFIVIASGRSKAVAFVGLFVFMQIVTHFVKRFKLKYILLGIPVVLLLSYKNLIYYFSDLSTARGVLYYFSYFIAKDHFPLGAGFATYGTEFSRKIYSPIYYKYGIDSVYGLRPEAPLFIADTMWPAILGETGFIGVIAIVILFVLLFMFVQRKIKNKDCAQIVICLIIYLLIESIADSIFMSSRGCTIAVVLAFMITYYPKEQMENNRVQAKL